ncbi:hypothetical protein [Streptomyces sp. NBC_01481]|uniref:hypothetical protein n=1 Tax=Streptomyces sp. NBC_01481 TaxID=2975869 RepID=UPI002254D463|nr:hypothetical protein [Streptomyces sp. NBC_01481]MCX4582402.1 hypothetical protein [Streptomyces sp. NBC_01481]
MNEKAAAERLRQALDDIGLHDTSGFTGSPTILVDGHDPFTDPSRPPGLACRIYRTPHGLSGVPEIDQLRQVLTAATTA